MLKIKWSKVLFSLGFLLIVSIGITQFIAWWYDYDPLLGSHLLTVNDTKIYAPWMGAVWTLKWKDKPGGSWLNLMAFLYIMSGIASFFLGLGLSITNMHAPDTSKDSRWATGLWDLRRLGFLSKHGVVIGKLGKRTLIHSGDTHTICIAPTGSRKTSSIVVPTMFSFQGHIIINDPKGEVAELTSGYRETVSKVYRFKPMATGSDRGCRINPLDWIRLGTPYEMRDANIVGAMIMDPDGSKGPVSDWDHWHKSWLGFWSGLILYGLYAKNPHDSAKTLEDIEKKLLTNPNRPLKILIEKMLHSGHRIIEASAVEIKEKFDKELSGVLSTARTTMNLFRDPLIQYATSASDINMRDLHSSETPITLYLEVPLNDVGRTLPLMRLIWQQYLDTATEKIPPDSQIPSLLLVEELPSLGRFNLLQRYLGLIRGYKLRFLGMSPSLNEIGIAYGKDNSIIENCRLKIFYGQNDTGPARRMTEFIGTTTKEKWSHGESRGRWDIFDKRITKSVSYDREPLLHQTELMQLPLEDQIVVSANNPPLRCQKASYLENRKWRKWANLPPAKGR
jgi:type IV secretion system protein VirD4